MSCFIITGEISVHAHQGKSEAVGNLRDYLQSRLSVSLLGLSSFFLSLLLGLFYFLLDFPLFFASFLVLFRQVSQKS